MSIRPRGNIDGFFGLFIDNLVQLLVITGLTSAVCGIPREFIISRILPAAAISIILGNLFYAFQAWDLARRESRDDVTALPYGINTPSVFAFIFFIMGPIYQANVGELGAEGAWTLAWKVGIFACLGSGAIEFVGAFFAPAVRAATPRAALLSALAGIAIGFISMDFILQVFEHPILALIPMGIILMQYFSGVKLPFGLPAGLWALLVGTALAWGIKGMTLAPFFENFSPELRRLLSFEVSGMADVSKISEAFHPALHFPDQGFIREQIAMLTEFATNDWMILKDYLWVIIPMGLFNLVGSLQNIESAEAAGDGFSTTSSLMVNGMGSLVAGVLGSCFPTTIYIGHAGWKRLGARAGYSAWNGLFIAAICIFGLFDFISTIVPMEAVIGILIWIAIVITAQAFQTVPKSHAPAAALGLIPGIAAWGLKVFRDGLAASGESLSTLSLDQITERVGSAHLGGLIALDHGFLLTSMCWSAIGVMAIERRFVAATVWAWLMALFSFFGVVHAWNPAAMGDLAWIGAGTGWQFAIPYLVLGFIFFAMRNRTEFGGHSDFGEDYERPAGWLPPIGGTSGGATASPGYTPPPPAPPAPRPASSAAIAPPKPAGGASRSEPPSSIPAPSPSTSPGGAPSVPPPFTSKPVSNPSSSTRLTTATRTREDEETIDLGFTTKPTSPAGDEAAPKPSPKPAPSPASAAPSSIPASKPSGASGVSSGGALGTSAAPPAAPVTPPKTPSASASATTTPFPAVKPPVSPPPSPPASAPSAAARPSPATAKPIEDSDLDIPGEEKTLSLDDLLKAAPKPAPKPAAPPTGAAPATPASRPAPPTSTGTASFTADMPAAPASPAPRPVVPTPPPAASAKPGSFSAPAPPLKPASPDPGAASAPLRPSPPTPTPGARPPSAPADPTSAMPASGSPRATPPPSTPSSPAGATAPIPRPPVTPPTPPRPPIKPGTAGSFDLADSDGDDPFKPGS